MGFRISFVIFLTLWFSGCSTVEKDTAAKNRINHIVLCWLKESGNIEHCKKVIETSRSLADIPGVLEIKAGTAIQSDRDVVDDSFDVGLYFLFRTHEDLEKYIAHPKHKAAVKTVLLPLVDRIIVYDFIEPGE